MNGDYLSALALLKTAYDQHGATYIDYVTPFVGDTIRSTGMSTIDSGQLRDALVARYGLEIPVGVLTTITRRLSRRGFGRRSHGRFTPHRIKLAESYDFDERRATSHSDIDSLARSLSAFTRATTGRALSSDEAVAALVKYADNNGLPILKRMHKRTTLPASLSLNETEYITSKFVIHAFEGQLPDWDTLVMLAKGSKLASVLYLPDPQDVTRKIGELTALFDTPILLSALGYQGTEQERAARELLDLAYLSGIHVAAFDHTLDEIESVMSAVGKQVYSGGYSGRPPRGVEAHFLERGYSASDIVLLVGRLERDLRALRIRIVDRPGISTALSVNEVGLEEQLWKGVRYRWRGPLLHDLDALTSIFRLRKGQRPTKFEVCRAVFVTPNTAMARSSREFFYDEYGSHWPLAVTEDDFATLLWLKQPMAVPDLPAHRIVADAYAALEPGLVSWESFLGEIAKLYENNDLSHDDYYLLRHSGASREALMQETLGRPDSVDLSTARRIIARAKNTIRTPLQDEVDRRTAALAKERTAAADREQSLTKSLAAIERERDRAIAAERSAMRERDQVLETQRKAATQKAAFWAAVTRRLLISVTLVMFMLGVWFTVAPLSGLPPERTSTGIRWASALLVGIFLIVPAMSTVFNWDFTRWGRKLEVWISNRLEKKYLNKAGLDVQAEGSS